MKYLPFLLLPLLQAWCEETSRGQQLAVETNSKWVETVPRRRTDCSSEGSQCLDCKTVGLCSGGRLTEVSCRGLYQHCDTRTGTCSNERNRCMQEDKPEEVQCPGEGYFPDADSCRVFHVCEGSPLQAYRLQCDQLQVFDPQERKCTRPGFRARCLTFSCLGKQGRYTPYPGDRAVYGLCKEGRVAAVLRCPAGQELDEDRQKCVQACPDEQPMPDLDDPACRRYFRCIKQGDSLNKMAATCPRNRVFDPAQGKCVEKPADFKCAHEATPQEKPEEKPQDKPQAEEKQIPVQVLSSEEHRGVVHDPPAALPLTSTTPGDQSSSQTAPGPKSSQATPTLDTPVQLASQTPEAMGSTPPGVSSTSEPAPFKPLLVKPVQNFHPY